MGAGLDGTSGGANPYYRPFLSHEGKIINLAPDRPDWSLTAADINEKGQVVGGNINNGPQKG